MKKKVVTLSLVVALIATAAIGGTLAYFTDKTETEKNVFTVGNVEIELTEPDWVDSGSQDAPEVYPGEPLKKDPTVTNKGANPCFVRVKITGLDSLEKAQKGGVIGVRAGDPEKWTFYEGYYYYNTVLAAGETAEDAITHIVMPTDLVNGEVGQEFSVDVYAEAVQAQGAKAPNWAAVQGMTVAEIHEWFGTCGL
ncbi:MAG: SipW-dependent-type signal peptide-containing protein [Firmicutes bacterium]|nr:SipW-dependent-type signal peptide-containing protein [Bacillota bacterium]